MKDKKTVLTEWLLTHGRVVLYLVKVGEEWRVEDRDKTLSIPVLRLSEGKFKSTPKRDVWFRFADKDWHGVQYGDHPTSSGLVYCKQVA